MAKWREADLDSAKVLAILRKQGRTQTDLASSMKIDVSTLSKALRAGGCAISTLHNMAKALGIEPDAILLKGEDASTSGAIARRHRILSGLSTVELAERAGVSSSCIAKYERNKGGLNAFTAVCLAQALGMSVEKYLGYER